MQQREPFLACFSLEGRLQGVPYLFTLCHPLHEIQAFHLAEIYHRAQVLPKVLLVDNSQGYEFSITCLKDPIVRDVERFRIVLPLQGGEQRSTCPGKDAGSHGDVDILPGAGFCAIYQCRHY
jgi:hypothetical protein